MVWTNREAPVDSFASLKSGHMTGCFSEYKNTIIEEMCSVLWYFADVQKCYLSMHLCYLLSKIFFQEYRQEQRRMGRDNCSSMNEFIFLGITENLRTKCPCLPWFSLFISSIFWQILEWSPWLGWTPSCKHPCTFSSATSPSGTSAIPQPLAPRCW